MEELRDVLTVAVTMTRGETIKRVYTQDQAWGALLWLLSFHFFKFNTALCSS